MKTHDRDSFFKYCTARTAKIVLAKGTLRWSAPITFNDPFDHLFSIATNDDPTQHRDWFISECERFVFGSDEPHTPNPSLLSEALKLMRSVASTLDRDEVRREFALGVDEGTENARRYLSKVNGFWDSAIRKAKVFCVSEDGLNLVMWAHYAGEHSGVVLELGCIEHLDAPLCVARKVEYRQRMPKLGTYEAFLLHGLGRSPQPANERLDHDLAFVKAADWHYEKEWRCITYREDEDLVSNFAFWPEELLAIYLGCRISKEDRGELVDLVASRFPTTKIFQIGVDELEYRFNATRIR